MEKCLSKINLSHLFFSNYVMRKISHFPKAKTEQNNKNPFKTKNFRENRFHGNSHLKAHKFIEFVYRTLFLSPTNRLPQFIKLNCFPRNFVVIFVLCGNESEGVRGSVVCVLCILCEVAPPTGAWKPSHLCGKRLTVLRVFARSLL